MVLFAAKMYDPALFKAIIDNAVDGIVTIDRYGHIQLANPSLCRMFGYLPEDLVGKNIELLIPAEHQAHHQHYIVNYIEKGAPNIIGKGRELRGLKKDGNLFSMRLAVSKVEDGDTLLFAGIIQDLTPEKKAEAAMKQHAQLLEATVSKRTATLKGTIAKLEAAKEEISRALSKEREIGQMKSRFVSMASHEFKTPLSSIHLSAFIIERHYHKLDRQKITNHTGKIKKRVAELTNTLDDFLSVDKIDSGAVNIVRTEFNVCTLLEDICNEFSFTKKPGQQIIYRHHSIDKDCFLDKNLLRHCVTNLLSNAIKYSAPGQQVEVDSCNDQNTIKIVVRDYGIGIPEDQSANLFEAFFRASNARDIPGTGLGLNIVKKYTELSGGSVSYTRPDTEGSSFCLIFPNG